MYAKNYKNIIGKMSLMALNEQNTNAIIIQKCMRGYISRKNLRTASDNMTIQLVEKILDKYIDNLSFLDDINTKLNKKKCRNENFPSHISENLVKFALCKKYKIMPCWDTDKGDLIMLKRQIEVKGFMSLGPSSFGPTENWDWIYFIDCIDCKNKYFKIYEIKLSNKNDIWRNIVMSGQNFDKQNIPNLPTGLEKLTIKELSKLANERGISGSGNKQILINKLETNIPGCKFKIPKTYGQIADENKRGELRCCFYNIIKAQLDKYCNVIFDGHISELY